LLLLIARFVWTKGPTQRMGGTGELYTSSYPISFWKKPWYKESRPCHPLHAGEG
jgi:hypothetical protein